MRKEGLAKLVKAKSIAVTRRRFSVFCRANRAASSNSVKKRGGLRQDIVTVTCQAGVAVSLIRSSIIDIPPGRISSKAISASSGRSAGGRFDSSSMNLALSRRISNVKSKAR